MWIVVSPGLVSTPDVVIQPDRPVSAPAKAPNVPTMAPTKKVSSKGNDPGFYGFGPAGLLHSRKKDEL